MLKIFLSSTYRDLADSRTKILNKLNLAFDGVGMEQFIPDGSIKSQEVCIGKLKESDVVIFLISPYYGSLMDTCSLIKDCKAKCPMKEGTGKISYTHCEYKTTKAEGILHQTYLVEKGWNTPDVKKEALQFREEIGEEYLGIIDIEDPKLVKKICYNLASKIIEWHTKDKLDFKNFVDREDLLNTIIDNIDSKIEVWGVGGVGKTAVVEVALLIEKLKGRDILTIGTSKTYKSRSGFEDFRKKLSDYQYTTETEKQITIFDMVQALALEKIKIIPNAEEIITSLVEEDRIRGYLTKLLRKEKNLRVFIDDFHLATTTVVDLVKSLESIILSSRKNSYIGKDICITGIDEEDREALINLFSTRNIPEHAKDLIKKIAEGHPVSTELLVKNYNDIDFEQLKDFELKDADDEQVKDFYKRVIEEIFSDNPQALMVLNDLAVLNTALPTNIDKESVLQSYNISNMRKIFKALGDTGMLIKKEGQERAYEFYFKHIQDALEENAIQENHKWAISYYENKREFVDEHIDDTVEFLYHKVKLNPSGELVDDILEITKNIYPVHHGFKRLIEVGEELLSLVTEKDKAHVLVVLGNLYGDLGRFSVAENVYNGALDIFRELGDHENVTVIQNNLGNLYTKLGRFGEAERAYIEVLTTMKELATSNPDAYLPKVADTQNNIGVLYKNLGRYEEAKCAYTNALTTMKELAASNPDTYLPKVVDTQNNLGFLYRTLGRFEEAESVYTEALTTGKELAASNPDAYLPKVVNTQNNLGMLYADLGRFGEAEHICNNALTTYKELAASNPDAYLPSVAMTQYSLGMLYHALQRFDKAELSYKESLKIRSKLVQQNREAYLLDFTYSQDILGLFYFDMKNYEKAEKIFRQVLPIYEQLAEKYPQVYLPHVIRTLENLIRLYNEIGKLEETEKLRKRIEELKNT